MSKMTVAELQVQVGAQAKMMEQMMTQMAIIANAVTTGAKAPAADNPFSKELPQGMNATKALDEIGQAKLNEYVALCESLNDLQTKKADLFAELHRDYGLTHKDVAGTTPMTTQQSKYLMREFPKLDIELYSHFTQQDAKQVLDALWNKKLDAREARIKGEQKMRELVGIS